MLKKMAAYLLVVFLFLLSGCSNESNGIENKTPTTNITEPQNEENTIQTSMEPESLDEKSQELLDAYTFLTSYDGYDYQRAVSKFTIAYLSGDTDTVESFYLDNLESDYEYFPEGHNFADIEFMVLKFYWFNIDTLETRAQYEYRITGTDYYQYLDIVMVQLGKEWKVKSFAHDA